MITILLSVLVGVCFGYQIYNNHLEVISEVYRVYPHVVYKISDYVKLECDEWVFDQVLLYHGWVNPGHCLKDFIWLLSPDRLGDWYVELSGYGSWCRSLLVDLYGLREFKLSPDIRYCFSDLYVLDHRGNRSNRVREVGTVSEEGNGTRLVLARLGLERNRRWLNHPEGELYSGGSHSYEEQKAKFGLASEIYASHGAALANLIFAPRNVRVYELYCRDSDLRWYSDLRDGWRGKKGECMGKEIVENKSLEWHNK